MELDRTHFTLIVAIVGLALVSGYFMNKNDVVGKQMESMYAEQQAMQAEIDESREERRENMVSERSPHLSGAGDDIGQARPSFLGPPEDEF